MKTGKARWIRNTALIALLLFGSGALLASARLNRSASGGLRSGEAYLSSFLPDWLFGKGTAAISRDRNAAVLQSVFAVFDPSLASYLASVPIVLDPTADTAKAYPAKGFIGVSTDWDHAVAESPFRTLYVQRGMKPGDPVFMPRFKTDLLIHEFLHLLQVHRGIDSRRCYEAVARWYADPQYGTPSPNGLVRDGGAKGGKAGPLAQNRMKYILWHHLYNRRELSSVPQDGSWKDMQYGKRYWSAEEGVEEFAYIGQEILADGSASASFIETGRWSGRDWQGKKLRLREVSPEVIALYQGVFNRALIREHAPD